MILSILTILRKAGNKKKARKWQRISREGEYINKNANPHIDHIKWEERDSITALFFDDNNSMLITSYLKAKKILYGMDPITPAVLNRDVITSINT